MPMSSVRAIRGATQVEVNSPESIASATSELLREILVANSLTPDSFISILFTATADLNAAFPAAFAREVGFGQIPLICSVEIDVPGALPRVIRVLAHVESAKSRSEIAHIYLHGAKVLRQDLAQ